MIELLDASHQFIPPNSIFIPYTFKKRGGRKVILVPETSETNDESSDLQTDNVMADALAKAHLWTKQLQSGKYKSVRELSKAKKHVYVTPSICCSLFSYHHRFKKRS